MANTYVIQACEFKDCSIKEHPEFTSDIKGLFNLFLNEIEDGASPSNEYALFKDSCEELWNDIQ